MTTDPIAPVRAFMTPILLTVVFGMIGFIWASQQSRIGTLETELGNARSSLSVISENQRQSAADRGAFQSATTEQLRAMQDVLVKMGLSVERLTVLQEQRDKQP